MRTMGEMTLRPPDAPKLNFQETGIPWGSLYKCIRAGASPEFDTMLSPRIA